MLHNRRWSILQVHSAEELTEKLIESSWCGCCGFELGEYLWLNDSTAPDSVQEYAVVRKPNDLSSDFLQVESVTIGWCDKQELLSIIGSIHSGSPKPKTDEGLLAVTHTMSDVRKALGGSKELESNVVRPRIETQAEHGHCELCR